MKFPNLKRFFIRHRNPKKLVLILLVLTVLSEGIYLLIRETRLENHFRIEKFFKDGGNTLKNEKSPYLLQHANNPVHWQPWGEKALLRAQKEDKPIFLSIGYSTCHWCHVMEHESFTDTEVANVLNQHFVSIKVDREENPDIDDLYMTYVQASTGRGGWPLTAILTPQGQPFFGGTYYPKPQLLRILKEVSKQWETSKENILGHAEKIQQTLSRERDYAESITLNDKILISAYKNIEKDYDVKNGGFGGAPKFPPHIRLQILLRIAKRSENPKALAMVEKTLMTMAHGGIYDHLGGGFHRYATDKHWLTPHFEKMLYDQASLSWLYLEAQQFTQNPIYGHIAKEILDYVAKDMTHFEGGFYSAEDADSEGEEGKFYVWRDQDLKEILTQEEYIEISKLYGVTLSGNFEHKQNILNVQKPFAWLDKRNPLIQSAHQKLLSTRSKRIRPFKDEKIITGWNGLMIASMAKGSQVLSNDLYLELARKSAFFIKKNLFINNKLLRRYSQGEARHPGTLDDYAYLIRGLLVLYQTDFDPQWIEWAEALQKIQDNLFWDQEKGGYFYASNDNANLLFRKKNYFDNARPNSNGISTINLLQLHALTYEPSFLQKAKKIFSLTGKILNEYPQAISQLLIALDFYLDRSKEIAILDPTENAKNNSLIRYLSERFYPNITVAYGNEQKDTKPALLAKKTIINAKATFYICEEKVCLRPTNDLNEAKKSIAPQNIISLH